MAEQAIAHCNYCDWKARISGDEMIDIVSSLRLILLAHVHEQHADKLHDGNKHAIEYRDVEVKS